MTALRHRAHPPSVGRHRASETGVTLPIVAICAVGLLTFAGLVIDGGNAYATRREMQNAADAASLAGTEILDDHRLNPLTTTPEMILEKVEEIAADNGADLDGLVCNVIDEAQTVIQPCPTSAAEAIASHAAGVRVELQASRDTFFMRVVGTDEVTVDGDAAATIQALLQVEPFFTPFMICATQGGAGRPPLLLDDFSLNPAAIYDQDTGVGPWYQVNGPGNVGVDQCGIDSNSFRGWVEDSDRNSGRLGEWWFADTGNRNGPADSVLRGTPNACVGDNLTDCVIVAPICTGTDDAHNSGSNRALECVRFGAFLTREEPKNGYQLALLGPAEVTQGVGGGLPADPTESRLIKLVD